VVAWGINDFGQLGNGSTVYATSPGQVVGLEDIAVSDIAAAGWHSLAITTAGGQHLFLPHSYQRCATACLYASGVSLLMC